MESSNRTPVPSRRRRKGLRGAIESSKPARQSFLDYRGFIRSHYDGLAGKLTGLTGLVTGHEALAGRLIGTSAFDVSRSRRILDAGCGNGRYTRFLLREAPRDALI